MHMLENGAQLVEVSAQQLLIDGGRTESQTAKTTQKAVFQNSQKFKGMKSIYTIGTRIEELLLDSQPPDSAQIQQ